MKLKKHSCLLKVVFSTLFAAIILPSLFIISCSSFNAVLNSAIGIAASAHRKEKGECFVPCVNGTRCNPKNGFCEHIPCNGTCGPQETCDKVGLKEKCIPNTFEKLNVKKLVANIKPF